MYLAYTFLGPFIYLRYTWGCLSAGPGRRMAVVRQPSLFTSGAGLEGPGGPKVPGLAPRSRFLPSPEDRAGAWRASGCAAGVQRLGLRDLERRHGGREQRRQRPARAPAPCQVTSQVIVAVAWKAPPGCPALEVV